MLILMLPSCAQLTSCAQLSFIATSSGERVAAQTRGGGDTSRGGRGDGDGAQSPSPGAGRDHAPDLARRPVLSIPKPHHQARAWWAAELNYRQEARRRFRPQFQPQPHRRGEWLETTDDSWRNSLKGSSLKSHELGFVPTAPKSESLEIMALSHVRVVASPLDLLNPA